LHDRKPYRAAPEASVSSRVTFAIVSIDLGCSSADQTDVCIMA